MVNLVRLILRSWLPLGVAFLIGAAFVGVAGAHSGFPEFLHSGHSDTMNGTLTAKGFKYSTWKTSYLSVAAMDFAPDNIGDTTNDYYNLWLGPNLSNNDGGRCFNTGVNLPQGSKAQSITFYFTSGASSDFFGELDRHRLSTAGGQNLTSVSPVDDTGTVASATGAVPSTMQVVNNNAFSYGIGACFSGDTSFHGAKIKYQYRTAGA
jgi:hypothetical protein